MSPTNASHVLLLPFLHVSLHTCSRGFVLHSLPQFQGRGVCTSAKDKGSKCQINPFPVFATQLREFAHVHTELQEAMNELSEEHNTALREWEEQRSRLERELSSALNEKVSGQEETPPFHPQGLRPGGRLFSSMWSSPSLIFCSK